MAASAAITGDTPCSPDDRRDLVDPPSDGNATVQFSIPGRQALVSAVSNRFPLLASKWIQTVKNSLEKCKGEDAGAQ